MGSVMTGFVALASIGSVAANYFFFGGWMFAFMLFFSWLTSRVLDS